MTEPILPAIGPRHRSRREIAETLRPARIKSSGMNRLEPTGELYGNYEE